METSKKVQMAILCLLLLVIGGLFALVVIERTSNMEIQEKLKKSEASERTAWGKFHDLQENHTEEVEAAKSAQTLELWEVGGKLDKCRAELLKAYGPKEALK